MSPATLDSLADMAAALSASLGMPRDCNAQELIVQQLVAAHAAGHEEGGRAEREIQLCGPAVEELVEWASSSECLDDPEDEAHLRSIGARIREEGRRAGQTEEREACARYFENEGHPVVAGLIRARGEGDDGG